MIPLVHVQRQFIALKAEIMRELEAVIDSGQYVMGPKVAELEQRMCQRLRVAHAVAVANGTDALILTLQAYGIGIGDEVITTPMTFFATAEAISHVGATPVFVDIDPITYNIDTNKIADKISHRTKAILPVHLFGQAAHMSAIKKLAGENGLIVIEDACQAFGATYNGEPVGSLGDAACFSFFPTKNLSTIGDGGLIVTHDAAIAEKLRKLRHHGSSRKYYHDIVGYNSRLDEVHAAIVLVALRYIDRWNVLRQEKAAYYRQHLSDIPSIQVTSEKADRSHIYHLFNVESSQREHVMDVLEKGGIQSGVYYPCPLHLQEIYRSLGYKKGDLPIAEAVSQRIFALPLSPYMTKEEQDQVIHVLKRGSRS